MPSGGNRGGSNLAGGTWLRRLTPTVDPSRFLRSNSLDFWVTSIRKGWDVSNSAEISPTISGSTTKTPVQLELLREDLPGNEGGYQDPQH